MQAEAVVDDAVTAFSANRHATVLLNLAACGQHQPSSKRSAVTKRKRAALGCLRRLLEAAGRRGFGWASRCQCANAEFVVDAVTDAKVFAYGVTLVLGKECGDACAGVTRNARESAVRATPS